MPDMDSDLRQRMLAYYDERAPEYEEAYTRGTGTASISDPEVFKAETRVLAGIVGQVVQGRVMDLACGTAYWLPEYAPHCPRISLLDQSDKMLAEARARANRLGIADRCVFVQGDFFEPPFRGTPSSQASGPRATDRVAVEVHTLDRRYDALARSRHERPEA